MSTYTHDFTISLADGGQYMTGSLTVDKSTKKADQVIETSSDPLPLEFMEDSTKLIRQVADLFLKYDGLKVINFKEKTP